MIHPVFGPFSMVHLDHRMQTLHSSHSFYYTRSTTLNSTFSTTLYQQCPAVEKVEKVLERVVPSVTARFFVTTSKVSFSSISIVVVTHVHPRYRKVCDSSSCSP